METRNVVLGGENGGPAKCIARRGRGCSCLKLTTEINGWSLLPEASVCELVLVLVLGGWGRAAAGTGAGGEASGQVVGAPVRETIDRQRRPDDRW